MYGGLDVCVSNGIHIILQHCNFNFEFWPGIDAFWSTVLCCRPPCRVISRCHNQFVHYWHRKRLLGNWPRVLDKKVYHSRDIQQPLTYTPPPWYNIHLLTITFDFFYFGPQCFSFASVNTFHPTNTLFRSGQSTNFTQFQTDGNVLTKTRQLSASTLLQKWCDFRKNLLNIQYAFWFFLQFLSEHFSF